MSITARHLRRLASGERAGTTPATRRVLQALFQLPIDELLKTWSPQSGDSISAVDQSVGQSGLELLTMAAERSRKFSLQQRVVTNAEEIDLLTDEIRELASMYQREPLPLILGKLLNAQEAIFSSLEQRQKPANARQLYFLAAIIGGIFGYASEDVGRFQLALTHARAAYMWAEYADHHGLRAWVRGIQSYICYWDNKPWDAVRYANSVADLATVTRGTSIPWLYSNAARAWAALGNIEKTAEMNDLADATYERSELDELDGFGGICTFGHSRRLYYAARGLAALATPPPATETYCVRAVDAYRDPNQPDWDFDCEAESRISLALTRLAGGELDGALEPLGPVFGLAPERRTNDLVKTFGLLHRSLNNFQVHKAHELQEQIEAFTHTSLREFPI
ncbi:MULTISPECIES: hypothetical protein [unclassified Nocardia]|uniref:hypothetical protein n=1 Tax=unclassified Nocardia TaxID=2637762 RepID=UPI001CE4295B|nr:MULTISPECIES: hypothetical protein [unclassified Nocardia]